MPLQKKNIFDIIEAYYLSHFLRHLCQKKIISPGTTAIRFSKRDPFTENMLCFIADKTDLLVKKKGRFLLSPEYSHYLNLGYHIDKLIDSYGNFDFTNKRRILQLNKPAFAASKEKTFPYYDYALLLAILDKIDGHCILDLGCGMGGLMVRYCSGDKKRRAIGIDNNRGLCKRGNRLFENNGLKSRARIYYGDVMKMDESIPGRSRDAVNIVVANNFMNELFGGSSIKKPIEGLLAELKKTFPGRYLVIMDYYGVFGTKRKNEARLQHNYIHDIMQLFSGQGVPPANYKAWNKYYRKAKCKLIQVYEGTNSGVNWFVHVVKM